MDSSLFRHVCRHFALGLADCFKIQITVMSCLSSPHSTAMMWLSLTLELMYIGLLLISCTLLSVQLCIRTCCPSTQRWGQLLNAFAAVFTVLGGRYLNQTSVAFVFPLNRSTSLVCLLHLSWQVCSGWWAT